MSLFCAVALFAGCVQEKDYTHFVNPFIGTRHEGHCFPGATVPMGMVQASPESTDRYGYIPYDVRQVVGEWVEGSDFTEGNAWYYLFHVQHDVEGLMALMGGEAAFMEKLDSIFYSRAGKPYVKDLVWNIYGALGQYWHGNEPCHHVPYLYKYTSQSYKTDAILRYVTNRFSLNASDGLKGNDDCGQLSAWYFFTMSWFYPVDPCGGEFVLGAPQFPLLKLNLENGKTFTVRAKNISDENLFVAGVTLDGEPYAVRTISCERIMQGGELVFEMISRSDRARLQDFIID